MRNASPAVSQVSSSRAYAPCPRPIPNSAFVSLSVEVIFFRNCVSLLSPLGLYLSILRKFSLRDYLKPQRGRWNTGRGEARKSVTPLTYVQKGKAPRGRRRAEWSASLDQWSDVG